MKSQIYFITTAFIFAVIAVLHLLRIINGWLAVIGSFEVPMWLSWIAVAATGCLAYKGFTMGKK
ncbi:MAG: hypothetical protein AAB877_03415 [Patescibacteria group bacterium]